MNTGIRDVLYRVRYFLVPYMVLLCACLLIKLLFSRKEIYFAVNGLYSNRADLIAPYVTHAGDGITIIIISAILLLFSYRAAFLLISSYAVTSIAAQILKYSFDMPRPKVYFEDQVSKIHFVKDLYILSVHSFPSGHTVTAFSAGIVITYLVNDKRWGLLLLTAVMLIGYSRMYLSQHFFEDVLAGSVIGAMVTIFWLSFIGRKQFLSNPRWARGLLKRY